MFPLSIKSTLSITAPPEKESFCQELIERLRTKLDQPEVAREDGTTSIRFRRGFSLVGLRFNWVSGSTITVEASSGQIAVTLEVFFLATLAVFSFVQLGCLVLFLQGTFQWQILLFITGTIWFIYLLITRSTVAYFRFRIKNVIQQIQSISPQILPEQTGWMNSQNQCPACGHPIHPDHQACPDCQLQLK
jgi:hypothetical protein